MHHEQSILLSQWIICHVALAIAIMLWTVFHQHQHSFVHLIEYDIIVLGQLQLSTDY